MGYTTDFEGRLEFNKPLNNKQKDYINLFCSTRRMKRDNEILQKLYNGEHGLDGNYGNEGEYFAMEDGQSGQSNDESIIDYNEPPNTPPRDKNIPSSEYYTLKRLAIDNGTAVPGLWCNWCISEDGKYLQWDGGEKFYNYIQWLQYLINHFFNKWDVLLNGEITWVGEGNNDFGKIVVIKSNIDVKIGQITYI